MASIMRRLHLRGLMPDPDDIAVSAYNDNYGMRPLNLNIPFGKLGIGALSSINVRFHVLGGTQTIDSDDSYIALDSESLSQESTLPSSSSSRQTTPPRNFSEEAEIIKCARCPQRLPQNQFPRKQSLERSNTSARAAKKADDANMENNGQPTSIKHKKLAATVTLIEFSKLLEIHRDQAFEFEAFVELPECADPEQPISERANEIKEKIRHACRYRFK
ncbi:hypothetical protein M422DRAFT_52189 [Sphaerobolus stellatus SS14]|uniref:Uncharacterized protein n=1 Tax=Sphaerobolus stellatus (strain SS14) TaxID=990650 RepID=A0A0C9V9M3_SPHS4|nr:hypothetical protein M422DRAFT_52189 [Sphaerobolus stellatus SS14]